MPTTLKAFGADSTWSSPNGTFCSEWSEKKKVWVRTIGYKALVRTDSLPVNNYENWWNRGGNPSHWDQKRIVKATGQVSGSAWGDSAATLANDLYQASDRCNAKMPSLASDKNVLLIEALQDASDAKVNLPVTFAEAHKTRDMILDRATRISNAYRALRRGNFKVVARELGVASNNVHKTWLEYKYGWMPLLTDVKKGAEALAQHHLGHPQRFTVSRKHVFDVTDLLKVTSAANGGGVNTDARFAVYKRTTRVKIYLEVVNPNLHTIQQMGLTNPLVVAWELIPFSFVADWFIQVGDYLTALTALQGLTVRKALHSRRDSIVFDKVYDTSAGEDPTYIFTATTYRAWAKGDLFLREPTTVDIFSLYPPVKINPWKNFWDRTVTGAALLKETFGRR